MSAHDKVRHHQLAELNQVVIGTSILGPCLQLVDHRVDLSYFLSAERIQIREHELDVGLCEVGKLSHRRTQTHRSGHRQTRP